MMSNETSTGLDPTITVTVTGQNLFFETTDSELFDEPSPDLLSIVAEALPSATTNP